MVSRPWEDLADGDGAFGGFFILRVVLGSGYASIISGRTGLVYAFSSSLSPYSEDDESSPNSTNLSEKLVPDEELKELPTTFTS